MQTATLFIFLVFCFFFSFFLLYLISQINSPSNIHPLITLYSLTLPSTLNHFLSSLFALTIPTSIYTTSIPTSHFSRHSNTKTAHVLHRPQWIHQKDTQRLTPITTSSINHQHPSKQYIPLTHQDQGEA